MDSIKESLDDLEIRLQAVQFGKVTAHYNQPRLIQLSGRFTF